MQVLNDEIVLQKIKENEDEIRRYGVSRVGLFGSFARGEQEEGSDVDLLVEFDKGKKLSGILLDFRNISRVF